MTFTSVFSVVKPVTVGLAIALQSRDFFLKIDSFYDTYSMPGLKRHCQKLHI